MRDVRIAQIYEGTNGIQALDLMGRKTVANGGAFFNVFADEIDAFIADNGAAGMAEFVQPLQAALENLKQLTAQVIDSSKTNPNEVGAASVTPPMPICGRAWPEQHSLLIRTPMVSTRPSWRRPVSSSSACCRVFTP